MTIKDALIKYQNIEIDILLSHLLGKTKEFLYLHPEHRLTPLQYTKVLKWVKRREKGEPVAYILGYKDFYGLRFKVNRNVLIPRPETEMVVDKIIERFIDFPPKAYPSLRNDMVADKIKRLGRKIKILDIGTGSGCIIISLAKFLKAKSYKLQADFYASDISKKALAVAKQNAKNILYHHTRLYDGKVKFVQSDLLDKIKFNPDIIIANLPYGWNEWKNNTSAETVGLKYEPKSALFTKEKGLFFINKLLKQIAGRQPKPSLVFLEFDPRQKKDLSLLIKKSLPKASFKFYKDFGGLWRYIEITINN